MIEEPINEFLEFDRVPARSTVLFDVWKVLLSFPVVYCHLRWHRSSSVDISPVTALKWTRCCAIGGLALVLEDVEITKESSVLDKFLAAHRCACILLGSTWRTEHQDATQSSRRTMPICMNVGLVDRPRRNMSTGKERNLLRQVDLKMLDYVFSFFDIRTYPSTEFCSNVVSRAVCLPQSSCRATIS
jgi:hypothetical protein